MLVIICAKYWKNPSRTGDAKERTRFSRPRPNVLEDIGQGQRSLYATHPLIPVIICAKYGKNPSRTVDFFSRTKPSNLKNLPKNQISRFWKHSVESPSMVDPQWNIWYWGSKWNLHTVCWDAVGCEWGTTSVYFGITYVCFIPSRLPVSAVEPQHRHQDFLFLSKVSFEGHIQNLKKNSMLV